MNRPNPAALEALEVIEREVEAEAREYGRRRLQERLQQLADRQGEVFPPGRAVPAPTGISGAHAAQPAWAD